MAVPDGWPSARVRAGAQNPAYRPARPPPALGNLVLAGAPATLRVAAARACGGGKDKGRRFALSERDQSPLSRRSGRGAASPRGTWRD
jgi:hypothetical protein